MKRQTQVAGVRRWYADDLLELQSETLKALDGIVSAYKTPFVISGCERQPDETVSPGYVALAMKGEEGLKIMPFEGFSRSGLFYILARKSNINSVYADGVSRLSAYEYEAWGVPSLAPYTPEEMPPYIEVTTPGTALRFTDVIQDRNHRFVTDYQVETWNGKETPNGAQAKASKAQREAERNAIMFSDTAREDAKKHTDTRETETRAFIGQVEAGLHRITESLTTTKADKTEVALKADKAKTFTLLPQTGANFPVSYFRQPSMWYSSTGDSDNRGWYLNLGDAERDVQLRFLPDGPKGLEIHCRAGTKNSSIEGVEILHTGNTMQVVKAGKVSGNTYSSYIGTDCVAYWTGSTCRLSHFVDWDAYMVNITPWGSAKSFSISAKEINFCDIQFSAVTQFEVQIVKYDYI